VEYNIIFVSTALIVGSNRQVRLLIVVIRKIPWPGYTRISDTHFERQLLMNIEQLEEIKIEAFCICA
jgi:hypothetical protein